MSEAKIILTAIDQTRAAFDSAKQGLQGLHVSATSVKATLAGLGATAAVLTFGSIVKGAIDAADQLNKLSQRAGVSTEKLSELQFAAKLSDVSADSLATAMKKLNVSIAAGLAGDKEKIATFKNLGISLKDAQGNAITADQALIQMANTFVTAKDGATKAAYAVALMGKAGDEMIPFLNGGGRAIEDLMGKARRMGLTISSEFAKDAEDFNDNLTILKASSDKLAISLGTDFVASMGKATKAMADAAVDGGKLAGIIAFIQNFVSGDDQHKNNVALVENLEAQLNLEKSIAQFRAQGYAEDSRVMVNAKEKLASINAELKTTLAYRKELAGQGPKKEEFVGPPEPLKTMPNGTKTVSEYEKLNKEMTKTASLAQAELDWGGKLSESEKFRADMLGKINEAYKKGDPLRAKLIAQLEDTVDKLKANELAESERSQAMQEATARQKEKNEGYEQARILAQQLREEESKRHATARDYLAQVEFEISLLGMSNQQREVAIAMREIERQGIKEGTKAWEDFNARIREAVSTRSELQQAADRFQTIWHSVDQTARQVFTDIFHSGSDVFKRLGQTLKASVLNLLYQATVRPWLLNIVANVTGGGGGMAGAGATGAVQGAMGSLSGLFGGGSALAGISSQLGAGAALSSANGLISGFGMNMSSIGNLVANGAITQGIGMAIPYIGWAMAAYSLINSMTKGETRGGGQYGYSFDGKSVLNPRRGSSLAASDIGAMFLEGPSGGDSNAGAAAGAVNSTVAMINSILKGSGSSLTLSQFQAGYEGSDRDRGGVFAGGTFSSGKTFGESGKGDNYAGTLFESTSERSGDLQKIFGNFLADQKQVVIQAVQALAGEIPATLTKMVEGIEAEGLSDAAAGALVDKLMGVVTGVQSLSDVLTGLPAEFTALKDATFDMKAGVIEAAGGIQGLTAGLVSFYDKAFTAEEKQAAAMTTLTTVFEKAGIVLPSTVSEYRDAVLEAQKHIDSPEGQRAFATLIGNFDLFYQTVGTVSDGVGEVVDDFLKDYIPRLMASSKAAAVSVTNTWKEAHEQIAREGVRSAVDQAQAALTEAHGSQNKTLIEGADRLNAFSASVREFIAQLTGSKLGGLSGEASYTYARRALAGANGENYQELSQRFLDAAKNRAGSKLDYRRDVAFVQRVGEGLAGSLSGQAAGMTRQAAQEHHRAMFLAQARLGLARLNESTYGATQAQAGPLYDDFVRNLFAGSGMGPGEFQGWARDQLNLSVGSDALAELTASNNRAAEAMERVDLFLRQIAGQSGQSLQVQVVPS